MVKESLTKKEQKLLRNYSQKGRSFPVGGFAQSPESCGKISSVKIGTIDCRSGYLAVCDSCDLEVFRDKTIIDIDVTTFKKDGDKYRINFNSSLWVPPRLLQGLDFLVFRNLWGDGLFGALSSENRIYVETGANSFPNEEFLETIERGQKIEEKKGQKNYNFEGFIGIRGGSAAITDPEIHKISYAPKCFSISTVLEVEPGTYSCRFIEENKKFSIKKIKPNP